MPLPIDSESQLLLALDKGATMGMFLRWLTEVLGGVVITPGGVSSNPVGPNRNLHIHARYFYVRDLVDGQEYVVYYVNTKDQLADMLCTYKRDWTNSVTVMVAHFGLAMTGFDSRHEEISRRVVSGSQFGVH